MADDRPVSAARLARSQRWALAAAERRRKRLERKDTKRQRNVEQATELAAALEQTGGNVASAGQILGLTIRQVYARKASLRRFWLP